MRNPYVLAKWAFGAAILARFLGAEMYRMVVFDGLADLFAILTGLVAWIVLLSLICTDVFIENESAKAIYRIVCGCVVITGVPLQLVLIRSALENNPYTFLVDGAFVFVSGIILIFIHILCQIPRKKS